MSIHLSSHQAHALSRIMQALSEPCEAHEVRIQIGQWMLELLGAQHYASYVWDAGQQCFSQGVFLNMDKANLQRYEDYFQFRDPITLQMQKHRDAVRVTEVMEQRALQKTEFFNDFLKRDGLHWGVNLYAWSGPSNLGDMRIWRDRHRDNFSANDVALLNLVRGGFVNALARGQSTARTAARPLVLHPEPDSLPCLSHREREVVCRLACGHSDKDIAAQLGIGLATVRTHIESSFRKTGVSNRVALAGKWRASSASSSSRTGYSPPCS